MAGTSTSAFTLDRTLGILTERLGPLPLINHFLSRMGLLELLEQHIPTTDGRNTVSHAQALGVLLRSIIVEREPIYRQQESTKEFAAGLFGVDAAQATRLSDDRIGRALDRLFDADRAALLTEVVLAVAQRFGVRMQQLHNDSTSVSLCGQYRQACGRHVRARSAPAITFGHPKNHRPDLKQLLFILTIDADGGVPVQFRCADGNTTDVRIHIETWNTLRVLVGRPDLLYVADSKLCAAENMQHIAARWRTLRDGDAALAPGRCAVPKMDSDQFTGLGAGVGPAQPARGRRSARRVARLQARACLSGAVPHRVGVEQPDDPAPHP